MATANIKWIATGTKKLAIGALLAVLSGAVLAIPPVDVGVPAAYAAAQARVGDPIWKALDGLKREKKIGVHECDGAPVASLASWRYVDAKGEVRAAAYVDPQGRIRIVMTIDDTLYGDRTGIGRITDVGEPGDDVFGDGPCEYLGESD